MLAGRDVNENDTGDRPPVAVINESFARQIYPGDNPIGRQFILNLGNEQPHEIIGVVGDVKLVSLDGEIRPTAYLSSRQYAFGIMTYVVRTDSDPSTIATAAVRVIREIDPLLPVSAVRPLDEVFAESIARARLTASAMSIFAGAALLLAALGVYGIVAYSVAQRSREFGIRVALGAKPGQIISMVVGQNLRIVAMGLILGMAGGDSRHADAARAVVSSPAQRSGHVRGHRRDAGGRRGGGVVPSGTPGHASRSEFRRCAANSEPRPISRPERRCARCDGRGPAPRAAAC